MEKDSTQYKVVPTRQCLAILEKSGLTIHDESDYRIKSNSGLVYVLPDSEVLLIPTNFDLDYPGIIFKNLDVFKYYAALDYFPIGEENMTWFEHYNHQLKKFRTEPEFYSIILTETLNVSFPFRDVEDIKTAFLKVQTILGPHRRYDWSREQAYLVYSFGMAVINYLIDYQGYNLLLTERHENYNPVTDVILEKDGQRRNIQTKCYIFLDGYSPNALGGFMHSIGLN